MAGVNAEPINTTYPSPGDELLDVREAAKELRVTKACLDNWRCADVGGGPAFVRLGRLIRYRRSDLLAFVAANTVPAGGR